MNIFFLQNQEDVEASAYGLRAVDTVEGTSQRDVFSHYIVPSQGQSQSFNEGCAIFPSIPKPEYKDGIIDHEMKGGTKRTQKEALLCRSRLRSWRMSEPFTVRNAIELIKF